MAGAVCAQVVLPCSHSRPRPPHSRIPPSSHASAARRDLRQPLALDCSALGDAARKGSESQRGEAWDGRAQRGERRRPPRRQQASKRGARGSSAAAAAAAAAAAGAVAAAACLEDVMQEVYEGDGEAEHRHGTHEGMERRVAAEQPVALDLDEQIDEEPAERRGVHVQGKVGRCAQHRRLFLGCEAQ
eukprot:scaffold43060_cov56-Phaeocystis_antarctica.AAC.6